MNEYCITYEKRILVPYAEWIFGDLMIINAENAAVALEKAKKVMKDLETNTEPPFGVEFRVVKIEKV